MNNSDGILKQTKVNSFIESIIGALLAAPTATGLHWLLLELWENQMSDPIIKAQFVSLSWVSFFIHSVLWKFVIRRVLVHYNAENLTILIKKRLQQ